MVKKALITGITGQDGSYLAELLLEKDYEVHGIVRRTSTSNNSRIAHLCNTVHVHQGDLLDMGSLLDIVREVNPDEVYNLAAQSHVHVSFTEPIHTGEVTGLGVTRLLEAVRTQERNKGKQIRVYQAGSSELFGDVQESPQNELTEIRPRSPYGVAKAYGHYISKVYNEAYNMHISRGILFNHESARRGKEFVTRKITRHVAKQLLGLTTEPLELGNMDARRDWGHAKDYVKAAWLMLQQDKPGTYVIAMGQTNTVREFVTLAYKRLSVNLRWDGRGADEQGFTTNNQEMRDAMQGPLVKVNPKFYRPAEVELLFGDASKAREELGWKPEYTLETLVAEMVDNDVMELSK